MEGPGHLEAVPCREGVLRVGPLNHEELAVARKAPEVRPAIEEVRLGRPAPQVGPLARAARAAAVAEGIRQTVVDRQLDGSVRKPSRLRPATGPPSEEVDHLPGELSRMAVAAASRTDDLREAVLTTNPARPAALTPTRKPGEVPGRGPSLSRVVPAALLPAYGPTSFAVRKEPLHPIADALAVALDVGLGPRP